MPAQAKLNYFTNLKKRAKRPSTWKTLQTTKVRHSATSGYHHSLDRKCLKTCWHLNYSRKRRDKLIFPIYRYGSKMKASVSDLLIFPTIYGTGCAILRSTSWMFHLKNVCNISFVNMVASIRSAWVP